MNLCKSLVLSSLMLSSLGMVGAVSLLPQAQPVNKETKSSQLFAQKTAENDFLIATIDKCILLRNAVQCSVIVTGKKNFNAAIWCKQAFIGPAKTRIFDNFGNVYICSKIRVSSEEKDDGLSYRFPEGIPVKINFVFNEVPPQTQELAGLEMGIGSDYYQFKNIKIAK